MTSGIVPNIFAAAVQQLRKPIVSPYREGKRGKKMTLDASAIPAGLTFPSKAPLFKN